MWAGKMGDLFDKGFTGTGGARTAEAADLEDEAHRGAATGQVAEGTTIATVDVSADVPTRTGRRSGRRTGGEGERTAQLLHLQNGQAGQIKARKGVFHRRLASADRWRIARLIQARNLRETRVFTITATVVLTDGRQFATRSQPVTVSPYLPAPSDSGPGKWVIWGGSLVALAAGAGAVGRCRPRRRRWGRAALLLILVTYIPPFSFLPNPLGLLWTLAGGYTYDTRLPFVNPFVMLDDPTRTLAARLETLIGRTGLDPLDPHAPLIGYAFTTVTLATRAQTQVHTEMIYADGTQRWYDLPVYGSRPIYRSYGTSSWLDDTLGRVTAVQQTLSLPPPVQADNSIVLGDPQRLPLHPNADRLDTGNNDNWLLPAFTTAVVQQRLVPAPAGDAFLLTTSARGSRNLWLVPLNGHAPTAIADGVTAYGWTPDSGWIVYTLANATHSIVALHPNGRNRHEVAQSRSAALPGLSKGTVWYTDGAMLHTVAIDTGAVTTQPLTGPLPLGVVRPSPNGRRVAYRCADHWCLQAPAGGSVTTFAQGGTEAAWSPDGHYLALADPQPRIYAGANGQEVRQIPVEPGLAGTQLSWTADSRYLLSAVFPDGGRRIIAADTKMHDVWDLSRPQWDADFALLPNRGVVDYKRAGRLLARSFALQQCNALAAEVGDGYPKWFPIHRNRAAALLRPRDSHQVRSGCLLAGFACLLEIGHVFHHSWVAIRAAHRGVLLVAILQDPLDLRVAAGELAHQLHPAASHSLHGRVGGVGPGI